MKLQSSILGLLSLLLVSCSDPGPEGAEFVMVIDRWGEVTKVIQVSDSDWYKNRGVWTTLVDSWEHHPQSGWYVATPEDAKKVQEYKDSR